MYINAQYSKRGLKVIVFKYFINSHICKQRFRISKDNVISEHSTYIYIILYYTIQLIMLQRVFLCLIHNRNISRVILARLLSSLILAKTIEFHNKHQHCGEFFELYHEQKKITVKYTSKYISALHHHVLMRRYHFSQRGSWERQCPLSPINNLVLTVSKE